MFWLDPRLQLRFEILPGRRLAPFVLVGGGSPIALSSARQTFDTGIVGDGFIGGGVRFDTTKGFLIRTDARVSFLPGADALIAVEVEIGFGLEFQFGEKRRPSAEELRAARPGPPPDKDGDKVPDAQDGCPDRAEDVDGFDDADGCPDIDNDLDRVLDIADKCVGEPEKYNGYQDEDGCPDDLPSEVDGLRGTVEGLIYAEGETVVRDSAQPSIRKIAKLMTSQPTIRVVLIGHTDDREAKQFARQEKGQPAPDLEALAADLSRARAEAVKQVLVAEGIAAQRIDVEGHGAEEPVVDNDKARGRLANRRVEIKLYVPPSAK
ncbi:MAG: OmpA family protein [Kofleriaceae bacterium]